ncbi:hypothetical protein EJ110_NYTH08426 [Nymphaea thermarum]|nr:hypothetical protein EJ110_NYTH08426 [Nymphaea thermarum]
MVATLLEVLGVLVPRRLQSLGQPSESIWERRTVKIIANDERNRIEPSWMAFTDNKLTGEVAKN